MTETEFYGRYRISRDEILRNRRAYHYLREYVLRRRDPEILQRAYREIGKKGIVRIARWLHIDSDIILAIARRQAIASKKEAM